MNDERKIWLNGEIIPWDDANVHITSHGFSRASAIFDFGAFYDRPGGPAIFRLAEHAARLKKTASLLGLNLAQSLDQVSEGILAACRASGYKNGFFKIMAYLTGDGTFALVLDDPMDLAVFALSTEGMEAQLAKPVSACIVSWRKSHPATIPVEAKACANYLNSMLARRAATERGYDMGLMLDTQGYVAEGSIEGFYMVKDGRLKTAPLGGILASISRQTILDAASSVGVEIEEVRFTPETLMTADELFFTATPYRVKAVHNFEGREMNAPGPVSQKLLDFFDGIFSGRDDRFEEWFTPL